MQVTITKEHVDRALKESQTALASGCCPIWQALAEKLGNADIFVGYDDKEYRVIDRSNHVYLARFPESHPFWSVANWFDMVRWATPSMTMTLPVKPDFPVTADVELF